jgi:polysaccharide pyruvyl transferase WcaK-like protein
MTNGQVNAPTGLIFPDIANIEEVVIVGNYGGGNMGDEAMLDVLSDYISSKLPRVKIIVPARRPIVLSDVHPNPRVLPIGIVKGAFHALLSDMLIIGGGTIFSSHSGMGIRAIVAIAIIRKILLRKKFYFYGIGYSGSTPKMLSILSRLAFRVADAIYVRDSLSHSYLSRLIGDKKLFLIPELALKLKESETLPIGTETIFRKDNEPMIGFSLMYLRSSQDNRRVAEAVQGFIEHLYHKSNAKFFFLTLQPRVTIANVNAGVTDLSTQVINSRSEWRSDSEIAERIISGLAEPIRSNCHVLNYYPPSDTLKIIGELGGVLSMRYHCLIFAHMKHKPYLAISFDDKHLAFMKDYGGELLDISQVSSSNLIQKWEKMQSD